MKKLHLRIIASPTENRTVTPRRRKNAEQGDEWEIASVGEVTSDYLYQEFSKT